MNMYTQECIDGGSMVIGPALMTSPVMTALEDIKQSRFSDQADLECTHLAIEDDNWENLSEREKKVICALMANVYADYIIDMDAYISAMSKSGILLSVGYNGMVIPCAEEMHTLEDTFIKTYDSKAPSELH